MKALEGRMNIVSSEMGCSFCTGVVGGAALLATRGDKTLQSGFVEAHVSSFKPAFDRKEKKNKSRVQKQSLMAAFILIAELQSAQKRTPNRRRSEAGKCKLDVDTDTWKKTTNTLVQEADVSHLLGDKIWTIIIQ